MSCNYFVKNFLSLFVQDFSANDSTSIFYHFHFASSIKALPQRASPVVSLIKPAELAIESLGFGFATFCSCFFGTC